MHFRAVPARFDVTPPIPSPVSASHASAAPDHRESLFVDPVIAEDGHTYEREAIALWLSDHFTSPMTRASMPSKRLVAHLAMQQIVEELVDSPTLPRDST